MIIRYRAFEPKVAEDVFVAPNSTVIGRCAIEEGSSVWYNAVLRADVNDIKIGKNTNIQDGVVIHCDHDHDTSVGDGVTIGHNAIVHGCKIGNNCIIGMGSTILDGAVIGSNCIIGANSLVTSGKVISANSLVIGSPAKIIRELSEEEINAIKLSAEGYSKLAKEYNE